MSYNFIPFNFTYNFRTILRIQYIIRCKNIGQVVITRSLHKQVYISSGRNGKEETV